MEITTTGHIVCKTDKQYLEEVEYVRLVQVNRVPDNVGIYCSAPAILVLHEDCSSTIGWIPKARYDEVNEYLNKFPDWPRGTLLCRVFSRRIWSQSPWLAIEPVAETTKKVSQQPTPTKEAEPMAIKTPTIKEIIDANIAGVSTAAQLETGHVANLQLAKIVSNRVPAQYKTLLNTPFGHLALANAVSVAQRSLYPDNALLRKVSNAMVVDSYQQLLKMIDVPGIIEELLGNKQVLQAAAADAAKE